MRRFIAILTICSLTLAVGARAEQPDPNKNKAKKPKTVQKQQVAPKQPQQMKAPKVHAEHKVPAVQSTAKVHNEAPKKPTQRLSPPHPYIAPPPTVESKKIQKDKQHVQTNNPDQLQTSIPQQQPPTKQQQQLQANTQQPAAPLNKKNVKKYQPQHQNFHAQPKPAAVASVQFNKNYQISGAHNWSGSNYRVFRSYRPQWHDQGWWRSHHNRVSLISGGWYYWDSGYWYPAWGYDNSAAYYPYDGPIYSGPEARPADQVIADVQSALQEQGYYRGEVDGLLGPLTRQALAEYQQANGLYATQTIDEPTLQSLGLAG